MLGILARNIVANWIGYAVQIILTFFLTPFVVQTLGDVRYGAWTLVMGITGYYGLLDLGFRAGLTQYITRYLAVQDYDKLNKTASTGMMILSLIGAVITTISAIVAWTAPYLFTFPESATYDIQWGIAIIGLMVGMQFPFFVYSAVLTAKQRYDISNGIGIVSKVVATVLTVVLLKLNYGLAGLAAATFTSHVVEYVLKFAISHQLLPELKISRTSINWGTLSEFTVYGVWNVVLAGSRRLISGTDAIVIACTLPIAAVTPYALAVSVVAYFDNLIAPISRVFFPAATALDASGDQDKLQVLYLKGSRLLLCFGIAVGSVGAVWADSFYRLWLGPKYVELNEFSSAAYLFRLLIVASVLTAGQRIGFQVLLGARKMKSLAILLAAEGLLNLVLSLYLALIWGLPGIAIGTVIPAIVLQGIGQPYVVCQHLKIRLWKFASEVYPRSLTVLALMIIGNFFLQQILPPSESWLNLIFTGFIAGLFALLVVLLIGLCRDERHVFFSGLGWRVRDVLRSFRRRIVTS